MKRVMKVVLVLVGLSVFTSLCAASADAPSTTPAAPTNDKIYYCIEGYETLLPGDYYACRARYYFQRDHNQLAMSMLEEASYWANKDAQYALGLIYFNGDITDIPANRPLALAWFALSAERKDADHEQAYAAARAQSSHRDIQTSEQLLQKMKLKYGDKVAGVRAMRRFNHEILPLEQATSGGSIYLNGYSPYPENADAVVTRLHTQADKDFQGLIGTVTVGALEVK